MNLIHRRLYRIIFILGLLSLTLLANSGTAVNAQQRSREELLKEAGKLITDAERAGGEAFKKVEAGAFIRSLVSTSELLIDSRARLTTGETAETSPYKPTLCSLWEYDSRR